jgi:hypothetical protein
MIGYLHINILKMKMDKKKKILLLSSVLFILLIAISLSLVSALNPIGYLDSVTASTISGWACDKDTPSQPINVHVYFDGPSGSGYGVNIGPANLLSETAVNNLCGGGTSHRFSYNIPQSLTPGAHSVYVYGINTGEGSNALLSQAPKYFVLGAFYVFAVITDTHIPQYGLDNIRSIVQRINQRNVAGTVITGDIASDSSYVLTAKAELDALTAGYVPVPGNHDITGTYSSSPNDPTLAFRTAFGLSSTNYVVSIDNEYQAVFLSCTKDYGQFPTDTAHCSDAELNMLQTALNNGKQTFVFVHYPVLQLPGHETVLYANLNNFKNILNVPNLVAIVVGHDGCEQGIYTVENNIRQYMGPHMMCKDWCGSCTPSSPNPSEAIPTISYFNVFDNKVVITQECMTNGCNDPAPIEIPISVDSCISFTYSDWSECSSSGTQTRTETSRTPAGCMGTPILSQQCNPPGSFVNGFNSSSGIVREGGTVPLTYYGNIRCENTYCSFKMQTVTLSGTIIETWITLYDGSEVQTNISSFIGVSPTQGSSLSVYNIYYALSSEGWAHWRNISVPCKECTFFPGDYYGEGISDLIGFSNVEKKMYYLLSPFTTGWNTFDIPGCSSTSAGCNLIPISGDFDGDKKSDLVVYDLLSGMLGWLLSSQDYLLGGWGTAQSPCKDCTFISGDYNGDNISDFVGYNKESKIIYYALSPFIVGWGNVSMDICTNCTFFPGDYNGDGVSDFLGLSEVERKMYYNIAPFGPWGNLSIDLCPGEENCNILPVSGDFNGDKRTDILGYNPLSGAGFFTLSTPDGGWTPFNEFNTPCKNCTVIPGDYDGDGISDLVLYNSYSICTPINGGWSDWSSWSNVGSCGSSAGFPCKQQQQRTQTCTNPSPACGGAGCSGTGLELEYTNCGNDVNYGCSSGQICSNGVCVTPACIPNCAGKNCGDNGCGGSCGSCSSSAGEFCSGNRCMTYWYLDYDDDNFGNNTSIGCWEGRILQSDSTTKPYKDCNGARHYYVKNNLDCNFTRPDIYPGASEICNGIDNDCDGQTDEEGCINGADWTNLVGGKITQTNINDTVLMSISGTSLTTNPITYKIFGPQSFLLLFTRVSQLGSSDSPSWVATISGSPFSFNTSIIKNNVFITSKKSGELIVNNTYNNFLPVAIITSPVNELNISTGKGIIFNQSSYDMDDVLSLTWDFGDNTTQTITNYINNSALAGNPNFNTTANAVHSYSSSGRYLVKLTVEEMERGQKDSKEVYINVFNTGVNVFPVISSPNNETKEQPKIVLFDASKSFVVNCSPGPIGDDIITSEAILYCKYLHAPGASINSSKYEIRMNWTITGDPSPISVIGDWYSDYSNVVKFRQAFSLKGNHNLSLTMIYIANSTYSSKSVDRNFKVESLWDCSPDGSYWTNDRYEPVRNNCSYKQKELGHACCPAGKKCSADGSCRGYASYCWQYTDKSSCELFINYVPEKSAGSACNIKQDYYKDSSTNQYCSNLTSCVCKWDSNSNKCIEGINFTKLCWRINSSFDVEQIINEDYGECLWSTIEVIDNCNSSNKMITKKKASWVGKNNIVSSPPDWCKDIEISYQCVTTEKLPFFDKMGVIITIIFIIFIYFYVLRKQKKIVRNIEKKINPKKTKRYK